MTIKTKLVQVFRKNKEFVKGSVILIGGMFIFLMLVHCVKTESERCDRLIYTVETHKGTYVLHEVTENDNCNGLDGIILGTDKRVSIRGSYIYTKKDPAYESDETNFQM